MEKPASRNCSHCGQLLSPVVHGYGVDKDFNSVPYYSIGHQCPALFQEADRREKEIEMSTTMNANQKYNAKQALGYMNMWGS